MVNGHFIEIGYWESHVHLYKYIVCVFKKRMGLGGGGGHEVKQTLPNRFDLCAPVRLKVPVF